MDGITPVSGALHHFPPVHPVNTDFAHKVWRFAHMLRNSLLYNFLSVKLTNMPARKTMIEIKTAVGGHQRCTVNDDTAADYESLNLPVFIFFGCKIQPDDE